MKHLKIIALAAIAATALMAFAGSSASADVLCKAAPNKSDECPTASGSYGSGTTFKATSTNATLALNAFGIAGVTCSDSSVTVKTTSAGSQIAGVDVTGEIPKEGLTWSGCETEGFIHTACTVSANATAYGVTITATHPPIGNGHLVITSPTSTTVICAGVGMHCTYTSAANGITLEIIGGNPAELTAVNQILAGTGSGCPSTAVWSATYVLTSPTALWIPPRWTSAL